MGLNFRKSINLGKGFKLNVGKNKPSGNTPESAEKSNNNAPKGNNNSKSANSNPPNTPLKDRDIGGKSAQDVAAMQ